MARGHEKADLDPLGLRREAVFLSAVDDVDDALEELDYKSSGFVEADLEREMDFGDKQSKINWPIKKW